MRFSPFKLGSFVLTAFLTALPATAIFQNNPTTVTLTDVLVCLTLFQNPGGDLSAEQIATGVGAILGQTIPAESFSPVPTRDLCNFVEGGQAGLELADVIATLVVFQNPGETLTPEELIAGVNAILGTTLPASAVLRIPGAPTPIPGGIQLVPPVPAQANASAIQFSIPKFVAIPAPTSIVARITPGTEFTVPDESGLSRVAYRLLDFEAYPGFYTFSYVGPLTPPLATGVFSEIVIPGVSSTACVYVHTASQTPSPDRSYLSSSLCFVADPVPAFP